jgi:hypothetical protein
LAKKTVARADPEGEKSSARAGIMATAGHGAKGAAAWGAGRKKGGSEPEARAKNFFAPRKRWRSKKKGNYHHELNQAPLPAARKKTLFRRKNR